MKATKIKTGQYNITMDGKVIGMVSKNEKAGTWDAYTSTTHIRKNMIPAWCLTKKEAIEALIQNHSVEAKII